MMSSYLDLGIHYIEYYKDLGKIDLFGFFSIIIV